MLALLCDTCKRPIGDDGYDLTLVPGAVVPSQTPPFRPFSTATSGTISIIVCVACGRHVMEFLRDQLRAPSGVVRGPEREAAFDAMRAV
jgi:hypothetical protein